MSDPAQWYCLINGQQYGPVEAETLIEWIRQGRILPTTLVWRDGMETWQQARLRFGEHFTGAPSASTPGASPGAAAITLAFAQSERMTNAPPIGGTGGQTAPEDITARARQLLSGNWGLPIGFFLLLWVINMAAGSVPYLGVFVNLFLTGAFSLGASIFTLNFVRAAGPDIGQLFKGFERYGASLGAYLLIGLITGLGYLLLIVPGVILSLMYSQTFYILADDRSIGVWDAMTKSAEMMKGNKLRLFELWLRMFLWSLACLLTCGIGFIWLSPYAAMSFAIFYEDLIFQRGGFSVVQQALPAPEAEPAGPA